MATQRKKRKQIVEETIPEPTRDIKKREKKEVDFYQLMNVPEELERDTSIIIPKYEYSSRDVESSCHTFMNKYEIRFSETMNDATDLFKYEISPDARRYMPDTMLCLHYDQYWTSKGITSDSLLLVVTLSKMVWDAPQKLYELLFEIETMLSKINLINSFIDGYIENPTKENYNSLVEHLWIISTTAIIYSKLLTKTNKDYIIRQIPQIKMVSEASGNPIPNLDFENMSDYFTETTSNLDNIIEEVPSLIQSLDYARSGKRNEYTQLPVSKNNGINKRLNIFNTRPLYDMMMKFATTLTPNELFIETLLHSRDNLERVLQDVPEISPANVIIDHCREQLFTLIRNRREYINLIHFINLFFVFGNFEKVEEFPFVILNEDQMVDLEELQRTVFLYNNSHGGVPSPPGTSKSKPPDPIPRPHVNAVPEEMSIFTQKFTEPLCTLFSSNTKSGVYCKNTCIGNCENTCDCTTHVPSSVTIKEVATQIDNELKNNKIPSLPFIHYTKNRMNETWKSAIGEKESKEDIMEDKNVKAIAKAYCNPNNFLLRSVKPNLVPFGRIIARTNEYHEVKYEIDIDDASVKGLYNMLTGELINANPIFVDFMQSQPGFEADHLQTISHLSIGETSDSTNLMYVSRYKLSMIINFFKTLNYRNIIFVDESCEIYDLFSNELTKLEAIQEDRGLKGKKDKERLNKLTQNADEIIQTVYKYGLGLRHRKKTKKKTRYGRRKHISKKNLKKTFRTKKRKNKYNL